MESSLFSFLILLDVEGKENDSSHVGGRREVGLINIKHKGSRMEATLYKTADKKVICVSPDIVLCDRSDP